jgi:hypothetical protein
MAWRKYGVVSALVGLAAIVLIVVWPAVVRRSEYSHAMAAMEAISTIHTAEAQYLSRHGQYAASLAQLGPNGAGLIDKDLASGHNEGFEFLLRPTQAGYSVSAKPVGFGIRGSRTYYLDGRCSPIGDPVHTAPGRS